MWEVQTTLAKYKLGGLHTILQFQLRSNPSSVFVSYMQHYHCQCAVSVYDELR